MTYNMNIEQIKSLLSRFYEGQTTPEEERQLVAFFRREDVPEDLQQDKQLFLLLAQTSEQEMPQDIADEITAFVLRVLRRSRQLFRTIVRTSASGGLSGSIVSRLFQSSA